MKERSYQLIQHLRCAMYPQVFSDNSKGGTSSIAVSFHLQTAAELLGQMLNTAIPGCDTIPQLVTEFMDEPIFYPLN